LWVAPRLGRDDSVCTEGRLVSILARGGDAGREAESASGCGGRLRLVEPGDERLIRRRGLVETLDRDDRVVRGERSHGGEGVRTGIPNENARARGVVAVLPSEERVEDAELDPHADLAAC